MKAEEFSTLDGTGLAAAMRRGEVTQAEVIDAARASCSALNPALNAVIEFYADIDSSAVAPPPSVSGPLAGVPMLRKDVGAAEAGRLQECGSRLFRGSVPRRDSAYVTLCERAGLLFVGRSTTPEMAFSSATESVLCGITRNPWHLDRMAGGSSGGAAAAVAAGIVPIAHASDGGGSIRIPAAACGIVGLKPSRGRVSQGPEAADALLGLGVEFVVTRSIRDAAAALDILSQPQPGDPFVLALPGRSYTELAACAPTPLRIAVTTDPWGTTPVDAEIAAAVERIGALCTALGHHVMWASPRVDFESVLRVLTNCFAFGVAGLGRSADRLGMQLGPEVLEPVTLANWELSRRLTAADIDADLATANAIRREAGEFFSRVDVLFTPALANPPPPHGRYSQSRTDLDPLAFMRETQYTDQFLPLFNITGQPALSIPIGVCSSGLPIGLQIVARFGEEQVALALGQQLMTASPMPGNPPLWSHR